MDAHSAGSIHSDSGFIDLDEEIILALLQKDQHFVASFNGIRRLLKDVHQEKLTRALDRLVDEGSVVRRTGGYTLDSSVFSSQSRGSVYPDIQDSNKDSRPNRTWESDVIPPLRTGKVEKIIGHLNGKWFGRFRFVGRSYDPAMDRGSVEWITEDKATLEAEVARDYSVCTFRGSIRDEDEEKALSIVEGAYHDVGSNTFFNLVEDQTRVTYSRYN